MCSEEPISLAGNQVLLRDWRLPDLDYYRNWMRPDAPWKAFDGPYYPLPSPERLEEICREKQEQIEQHAFPPIRTNLVIADRATECMLGTVSSYWESRETNWLCVGIVIYDPAYWRGGRGFEALGLWSDYLFRVDERLVRLDLRTWSGNTGMMRLAEKLGYVQEARFRKARIVGGIYYDGLGYGVLREEWQSRYPGGFSRFLLQARAGNDR
ncbi:putative hydrolase of HD superfamily [Thermosporothrix hazakensis]|uniref:N-acetyltransferase domain-containing protein n=2 Tax=Thermosporothrix TaxID=768650 RepID=A0A455SRK2_9CHLR|nr:GNAT family protein [Thermosporothrix hazakensis]PZW24698.1 putative hydrolase of HD superfamily [Thermosporothrix hazakensis]BBH90320.1 hypothetical protein KTC_50710 [Thermosporothrix sp. COM3]GCE48356.1 hypothetical protein KTH_32250 [Thermosporothrix hazakensis]